MRIVVFISLLALFFTESQGFASFRKKENVQDVQEKKELDEDIDNVLRDLVKALIKEKSEKQLSAGDGTEVERNEKKDEILSKAADDIRQEQIAGKQKRENPDYKRSAAQNKLARFLKTTPYVERVSLAAKVQLRALEEYKSQVWQHEAKEDATREDFLESANQFFGGSVLRSLSLNDKREFIGAPIDIVTEYDISQCPTTTSPSCPNTGAWSYRTHDGSCNNEMHTSYGMANRAQIHLIPPHFSPSPTSNTNTDGLGTYPRMFSTATGATLPSARTLTESLFKHEPDINDQEYPLNPGNTLLTMVFGQFLDHDLTHTPAKLDCANCDETLPCFPILTPDENRDCMDFGRSSFFMDDQCGNQPVTQANTLSAFIDASQVYGSTDSENAELREGEENTGKLKSEQHPKAGSGWKNLLPYDLADTDCSFDEQVSPYEYDMHCFKAGDVRTNEQVGLTAMHTVFMRYHNYIVDQLNAVQGFSASAEETYQLARHILIGVWQNLVFSEWLPIILGNDRTFVRGNAQALYDLNILQGTDTFSGYDATIVPDISTVFATAAMRFGHTEITELLSFYNKLNGAFVKKPFHEVLFNPSTLYYPPTNDANTPTQDTVSGIDAVIVGMMNAQVGQWDRFFANEIRNHLFGEFDLPALNIQRGRDHGIPPYIYWRRYCGLDDVLVSSFDQLNNGRVQLNAIQRLQLQYDSVEDVDLYAGAMLERNTAGGFVGPTFACLLGEQFARLKYGDRLYYETDNNNVYTPAEIRELRRSSLAHVFCNTLDDVDELPRRVLRNVGDNNPLETCATMPTVNFAVFAARYGGQNGGQNGGQGGGGQGGGGQGGGGQGGGGGGRGGNGGR